MSAHLDQNSTELSVFHILHVITTESGTITSVNASVHKVYSPTEPLTLNLLLTNYTQMKDANVKIEAISVELNPSSEMLAKLKLSKFQSEWNRTHCCCFPGYSLWLMLLWWSFYWRLLWKMLHRANSVWANRICKCNKIYVNVKGVYTR